ncbi:MAG: GNAT family N-acetyltransferase [Spirochaetales bacterium]
MKFELSPELIDQIIFAMEDQENEYVLDVEEGVVCPVQELLKDFPLEDEEAEQRYISLPVWRSVDGFNLMERFTATLHNPIYRERLRQILSSGKGVFRQFKNVVKESPNIEKLWFRFKNREMKKEVYQWYNQLRSSWGLKEIEIQQEDTEDLVLTDFQIFHWSEPEDSVILSLDKKGFLETLAPIDCSEEEKEWLYQRKRSGLLPSASNSWVYRADNPSAELSGFLWAVQEPYRGSRGLYHILQVYCKPEYRGLGLARALLETFCNQMLQKPGVKVSVELVGTALDFGDKLQTLGFHSFSEVLEIDSSTWQKAK